MAALALRGKQAQVLHCPGETIHSSEWEEWLMYTHPRGYNRESKFEIVMNQPDKATSRREEVIEGYTHAYLTRVCGHIQGRC